MKLIELHILQSFPVSCLNRDDLGAPKTAVFGGVTRARISSQCLKRAIRKQAAALQPDLLKSVRTRLFVDRFLPALDDCGEPSESAAKLARVTGHYLGKLDPSDSSSVKTLLFLSPLEFKRLAKVVFSLDAKQKQALCEALDRISPDELAKADSESGEQDENADEETPKQKKRDASQTAPLTGKQFTKLVSKILKSPIRKEWKDDKSLPKDAADVAVFGRMVANDPSLNVEGAAMFSHALSTHKADNDLDFFSAVDDDKPREEDAGAGMIGTLEFTSAVYYRYAALNLDLLADKDHLSALKPEERRAVVDAFIRATLLAVPGARKNSMNSHTLPGFVLGLYKDRGQPVQLVNAFEKPIWSGSGLLDASIEALKAHHESLKKTWNLQPTLEVAIPDVDLNTFCQRLTAHVP